MARIGIDLGTTNTVVAMVYDDGPAVMPRGRGRNIPSVVTFEPEVTVGALAEKAGPRAVRSVKRLMGRTLERALAEQADRYFSQADDALVQLVSREGSDLGVRVRTPGGRRTLWAHEVSALILREARAHAESLLGQPVEAAAITIPAYFEDPHRQATLEAAREAGLTVVEPLLDEPTAAALAFAGVVPVDPGEPLLVVDWGGGTFDVTVLASDGTRWHQAGVDGDITLGGDDVDLALAHLAAAKVGLPPEMLDEDNVRWALLAAARRAKHDLSTAEETDFYSKDLLDADDLPLPPVACRLTRADLVAVTAPFFARFDAALERCLAKPDVDRGAIRKVLLAGGSTRLPGVRERLLSTLPGCRLHDEVDPMSSVALGAALHAHARPKVLSICPYSYAIEKDDGERLVVIPADSSVPTDPWARPRVPLSTRYDGQTVYRVRVATFAGGLDEPTGEQTVFARGFPPQPAGTPVELQLWLDENKLLNAACRVGEHGAPIPLGVASGSEIGPRSLFTKLDDRLLDAEATLEANDPEEEGLLAAMRACVAVGTGAVAAQDRAAAAATLVRLTDLIDQAEAKETESVARIDARKRVLGWLSFYERDLLPRFSRLLRPAQVEEAITALRGLRVMERTGAPGEELSSALGALNRILMTGDAGPLLRAWREAQVLGVPDRISDNLKAAVIRARDGFGGAGHAERIAEIEAALEECDAAMEDWRQSGALVAEKPDLRVE